jgi:hypothetical protein
MVRRMEGAGTLTEGKDVGLKLMEISPRVVGSEVEAGRWDIARDETRMAVAGDVACGELAGAPWWLWWNVLSLDAPMVAVAWALVFAKCAGVVVSAAEVAALGLVVWLIYTVDRLLDGRASVMQGGAGAFGSPLRQRHVFHRVYARAIAWVAAGVGVITAILVFTQIGSKILKLAVPVGLILVLYMAWVHLGRGREPKSSVAGSRESVAAGFGFGSGRFAAALAVCATLMAPVVRLRGEFSAIGAAIAVSALLILLLDLMKERISADALRVLVDVALLAPALVVLAIR